MLAIRCCAHFTSLDLGLIHGVQVDGGLGDWMPVEHSQTQMTGEGACGNSDIVCRTVSIPTTPPPPPHAPCDMLYVAPTLIGC